MPDEEYQRRQPVSRVGEGNDDKLDEQNLAELLDAVQKGEVSVTTESTTMSAGYSGPLPPPSMLAAYNDALPDGAKRIVDAWETESTHRRALEKRGQWIALGLATSGIIAGVVCAAIGQPWVGGTISVAVMVGIGVTGAINLFRR